MRVTPPRRAAAGPVRTVLFGVTCGACVACGQKLEVGEWTCRVTEGSEAGAPALAAPGNEAPVPAPWSTSFEDGFCGYYDGAGFCYSGGQGAFHRVTSPVRTGTFAAAFDVAAVAGSGENQARCVREGVLPAAASYGAWYQIPDGVDPVVNWNLFHFQGGRTNTHNLWDVSLRRNDDGTLSLYVFDAVRTRAYLQPAPIAVPEGRWFQVELFLRRASDATGELALHQDGELVLRIENMVTDDTDWGQWYVGNLAVELDPGQATVYVDDVTIRASR